jgi:hypothetical protein
MKTLQGNSIFNYIIYNLFLLLLLLYSLPANSLYGYILPFISGNKKSHVEMLKISEDHFNEGIVQFSAFGKLFVNVLDPGIANKVLKTVHGKGFIYKKLIKNILS